MISDHCDHYTLLGFTSMKTEGTETTELEVKICDLMKVKGENALKFMFALDQKLMQISDDATAETQVTSILNLIMESLKRFAPEWEKM